MSTSFYFNELVSNETIGYRGLLMSKLVKIWSGDQFYIQDESKASVDLHNKKIYLPLASEWDMLRALGQHEAAHILFTNTTKYYNLAKQLLEDYDEKKVWRIINALEDRRIEYLFTKIFPGSRNEFKNKNFRLIKEILKEIEKLDIVDIVLVQIVAYMINFPVRINNRDKELKELLQFVSNEITKKWTQASVVNAAKKVLEYLRSIEEEKKWKRRWKREETVEEGEDGKDSSAEVSIEGNDEIDDEVIERIERKLETLISSGEIQNGKFKSKAVFQKSIKKLIDERRDILIAGSGIGESTEDDPFKKIKTRDGDDYVYIPIRRMITEEEIARKLSYNDEWLYEQIVTENAGLITRLRRAIIQIRNTSEMRESKGGSININRSIQSYMQARMPTFDRAFKERKRNLSFTFLLDQSGSMKSSSKIERAKRALIILSEALKEIQGIEFSIFGFCSVDKATFGGPNYHIMKTYRYKGFSEKRTDLVAGATTGIGNRDGYHIRVVRSYILQHANPRAEKFLIVLSDGDPADNSTEYMHRVAMRDTMKAINETQIRFPVIGVLFGEQTPVQKYLYRNRVYCSHDRLDESLQQLVLNIQKQQVLQ